MRGGDVTDVVHVEAKQRSQIGFLERAFHPGQPLLAQPLDVDALFPIDSHQAESFEPHNLPPYVSVQAVQAVQIVQNAGSGSPNNGLNDLNVLNYLNDLHPLLHSRFAISATASAVGTVWSSSTGENGTGTSIAPIRFTGASR